MKHENLLLKITYKGRIITVKDVKSSFRKLTFRALDRP